MLSQSDLKRAAEEKLEEKEVENERLREEYAAEEERRNDLDEMRMRSKEMHARVSPSLHLLLLLLRD